MDDKVCPECHSEQIEKGIIRAGNGVVHMFPLDSLRSMSSPITSLYCSNCGYVLGLYLKNPERLKN